MNNLYTSLADVYDAMYRTFINYDDEFKLYSEILKNSQCNDVLEIGCGSGNLAGKFIENGFRYCGLDLSDEMLAIAKKNYPQGKFVRADVRNLNLKDKFQSAVITGRTISYLLSNKDVHDSFVSINKHLKSKGILCFDFIDANRFIPQIKEGEKVVHLASFQGKDFLRESFWKINFQQSWSFDWRSVYYEQTGGELKIIGEDNSTIRAFTKDEIVLFLKLSGFEIKEIRNRPSYAFDTFVITAQFNH
jgi:SAM-dependent methyltransferase